MAALGTLALISITVDEDTDNLNPDRNGNHPLATPFVKFGTYAFLPISLMIATIHVLYGAKAPGDGFTAGVFAGLGIASWYIVFGYSTTKQRIQWFKEFHFLSFGLALAFVNALFPLLAGEGFLQLLELEGVSFAGLHLSTTLIFEIAIALTVFGSVGIMLESLAKPKQAEKLGGGVSYDDSGVDDGHYERDPEGVTIHHTEELISTPEH
jgi:multisubunit Na+/H+ antiporter MnhB subunit